MIRLLKRSLVARLVSSFVAVAIAAMSLVGYTTYRVGSGAIQASVIERLSITASLKEAELNRWVDDQIKEVQVLAASPIIRTNAAALIVQPATTSSNSVAEQILTTYLPAIVLNKSTLAEIFILSNDGGKIIYSTNRDRIGLFRLADRYFVQGQRGIFVQNVYPSPVTLKPTMTIAAPLYDPNGTAFGVLAAHINLDRLDQIILERVGIGASSETYLVDQFNEFVSGQRFGRNDFPRGVHTVGIDAAVRGEDGAALYTNYRGVPVVGVYRWVEKREFALLTEMSQTEAFAPARRLAWTVFGVGLIMTLTLALLIYLLTRQIVRPVTALTTTAARVAAGNLSVQASVITKDEIGALAQTFNRMIEQLRQNRDHLEDQVSERTTALSLTNERLQQVASELSQKNQGLQQGLALAHDIQLGLLPDRPPWEADKLIAFGFSQPSAEVGGDFYTFLALRDGNHVGVAIGDISGKGVGAALMMALTASTVEERARDGRMPNRLLEELNERLIARLRANSMNAALQYVLFDPKRDLMHIANAGMIAPLLLRDGVTHYIDVNGLPLGSLHPIHYSSIDVAIVPNDVILLVSDGVVEAHNEHGEMFGFDRLEQLLVVSAAYATPEQSVNTIVQHVVTWMGTAEQHDDITVVWLQIPSKPSV